MNGQDKIFVPWEIIEWICGINGQRQLNKSQIKMRFNIIISGTLRPSLHKRTSVQRKARNTRSRYRKKKSLKNDFLNFYFSLKTHGPTSANPTRRMRRVAADIFSCIPRRIAPRLVGGLGQSAVQCARWLANGGLPQCAAPYFPLEICRKWIEIEKVLL